MKVLVNMSTITCGGGLQASRSFVKYTITKKPTDILFHFIISSHLQSYLIDLLSNISYSLVKVSPARLITGFHTRKQILEVESNFCPDITYSIGFPSYVSFRSVEIGRYTNPWEIYSLTEAWSLLTPQEKINRFLKSYIRRFYAKRASFFETQTIDAASAISKTFNIPYSKIFVSPNVINPEFRTYNSFNKPIYCPIQSKTDNYSIFVLSADHKHKNLTIIPLIARLLKELTSIPFTFKLTLPYESKTWKTIHSTIKTSDISNHIINLGPLTLKQCLEEYKHSNLLFLPTLAEIFSSCYIEAMATYTPIVTTDLHFTRDICGNAALYFQPLSPRSAAKHIITLMSDRTINEKLINNGQIILKNYVSLESKYDDLVNWFKSLL